MFRWDDFIGMLPPVAQGWLSPHGRLSRWGFNKRLLVYSFLLLVPLLWGWVFSDQTTQFKDGLQQFEDQLTYGAPDLLTVDPAADPTAALQQLLAGEAPTTTPSADPLAGLLAAFATTPTETFILYLLYLSLAPTMVRRAKDLGWRPGWVLVALYARASLETFDALTGLALTLPGGWAWLVAELLVMTALSLWQGEEGPNRYGRDPLQPPSTLVPK